MISFPEHPVLCNFAAILAVIYIIPTYTLFGLIFYTTHYGPTRNQYYGPFFIIFSLYSIVAVFLTIAIYFQGRILGAPMFLPLVEALPHTGIFPTLTMALLYYAIISGQLVNSLITVNRFTVIFWKTKYLIWWRANMKFVILFVFIAPFALISQFPFTKIEIYLFYPSNPQMGYHIWESIPGIFQKSYFLMFTFGVTGIITLAMNFYISYFLIQSFMPSGGRGASQDHDDASPTNIRFFAFNLFVFSLEVCTAILQGSMSFFPTQYNTNPYLYFAQVFVAEINALGPAWFMLAINKPLRKDILTLLLRRRGKQVNVAVPMKNMTVTITP